MKNLKLTLLLAILILSISCSSKDDVMPTITVNDFSKTIDENQLANAVIGTILATSDDGTLTYSIQNQSPLNSIAVNANTGQITVSDPTVFDFETNPTINANINIAGNSITETIVVTISLNDIDDLEFFLSDSKTAYTDANNGDWVIITEGEYNNLEANINNVSRVGTTETEYNVATIGNSGIHNFTAVNKGIALQENSYVFAFKYYMRDGDDVTGFKIKQSETQNTGYADLGSDLPVHSGSTSSVYFVLKGNTTTYTDQSYLGFYKPQGGNMGFNSSNGNGYYYNAGDNNTNLSFFTGGTLFYQSLTTTQKQW